MPVTVEGTEAPIVVPSTVPPLISAVVIVPAFDIVAPVKLIVPVVVKFVAVIAPPVARPIVARAKPPRHCRR